MLGVRSALDAPPKGLIAGFEGAPPKLASGGGLEPSKYPQSPGTEGMAPEAADWRPEGMRVSEPIEGVVNVEVVRCCASCSLPGPNPLPPKFETPCSSRLPLGLLGVSA